LEKTQHEFQRTTFRMVYFLPFGKAHDTVIPSLPRARGRLTTALPLDALDLRHPELLQR